MQVKTIPVGSGSDSSSDAQLRGTVFGMRADALAVALCASDMPTARAELKALTHEERTELAFQRAVQGLQRLGLDEVQRRAAVANDLNRRFTELSDRNGGKAPTGSAEYKQLSKQERALWGGPRRHDRAVDTAWWIVWYRMDNPEAFGAAALATPVSVPPALMTVPLPRCIGCGHRTATAHPDCYSLATERGTWWPCDICCGLRVDADGFECQFCCGAGFVPELGRSLAEMAGDVAPWQDPTDTQVRARVEGATVQRPAHPGPCGCGPCAAASRAFGDVMVGLERS